MKEELDLNDEGGIRLAPLVSHETHLVAESFALLRLGYATTAQELTARHLHHLQLALSPTACRSLAEELLKAEQALLRPPATRQGN